MGRRCLAVRIVGFASTTHGFAFAVTEGPERLVDWGNRQVSSQAEAGTALKAIIERSRPLFVAAEIDGTIAKGRRGRTFVRALRGACAAHDIMILCVARKGPDDPADGAEPTNHDIAKATAERFRVIADKLPKRRKAWQGADDRIGVFLAVASAVAGWNHFRPSR